MALGIENPSKTGTVCVTPSPESRTIPVVRPDEYLQAKENQRKKKEKRKKKERKINNYENPERKMKKKKY